MGAEQLDRDIHGELQAVKVIRAQLMSLAKRHQCSTEIAWRYMAVLAKLDELESNLQEADEPVYGFLEEGWSAYSPPVVNGDDLESMVVSLIDSLHCEECGNFKDLKATYCPECSNHFEGPVAYSLRAVKFCSKECAEIWLRAVGPEASPPPTSPFPICPECRQCCDGEGWQRLRGVTFCSARCLKAWAAEMRGV